MLEEFNLKIPNFWYSELSMICQYFHQHDVFIGGGCLRDLVLSKIQREYIEPNDVDIFIKPRHKGQKWQQGIDEDKWTLKRFGICDGHHYPYDMVWRTGRKFIFNYIFLSHNFTDIDTFDFGLNQIKYTVEKKFKTTDAFYKDINNNTVTIMNYVGIDSWSIARSFLKYENKWEHRNRRLVIDPNIPPKLFDNPCPTLYNNKYHTIYMETM